MTQLYIYVYVYILCIVYHILFHYGLLCERKVKMDSSLKVNKDKRFLEWKCLEKEKTERKDSVEGEMLIMQGH